MSSSTIDEAIRLLELGYGDTERLKKIIEAFNRSSMISMYDRKYIESLVTTYLVANRRSPDKLPSDNKNDLENVRTPSKVENVSTICDNCKSEVGDNFKFCPSCGKSVSEISQEIIEEIEEVHEKKIDEPFVSYGKAVHVDEDGSKMTTRDSKKSREEELKEYERDYLQRTNQDEYSSPTYDQLEKPVRKKVDKKGSNSKFIFIGIGVAVAIVLGGGALFLTSDGDIGKYFDGIPSNAANTTPIATCETAKQLVKSTKVAGFPDPDKDYQYYIDRYDNEPSYQDWFHSTFPGQTVEEILAVPTSAEAKTKVSGFPDPDKDYQYYIDRYDNEPSYQDWFQSTFPGLTVYEAVC